MRTQGPLKKTAREKTQASVKTLWKSGEIKKSGRKRKKKKKGKGKKKKKKKKKKYKMLEVRRVHHKSECDKYEERQKGEGTQKK